MENEKCDFKHQNGVREKKQEVLDGWTIKYHANGKTIWSLNRPSCFIGVFMLTV